MNQETKVYLTSPSYELGDFHSIEEIDELKNDDRILKTFLTLGLDKYSKSNLTTLEMAEKSAFKTIEKSEIPKEDIDLVIYATYSFSDFKSHGFIEIGHLIDKLGLKNAYPVGIFLSGCGNLQTAIRVANNFIKSGECRNILLITTDRFLENESRIVKPNVGILSDGAASCVLTNSEVKGEFEVLHTSQNINSKISNFDSQDQSLEIFDNILKGVHKACYDSLHKTKTKIDDFSQLITNNYNLSVLKSFSSFLNFDFDKVYSKNISRIAHTSSGDNLINLHDFHSCNSLMSNELILLLGTGTLTWGCTVLSKL